MLSWLIALCLLGLALCPAMPPPMIVATAAVAGGVFQPTVRTDRANGQGRREDIGGDDANGQPGDPDGRDCAEVMVCSGCDGRTGRMDRGGGAGFAGCAG